MWETWANSEFPTPINTVDGYDDVTKTMYKFQGCFYHRCRKCYPNRSEIHRSLKDRSMEDVYNYTQCKIMDLESRGYKVKQMCECQWAIQWCETLWTNSTLWLRSTPVMLSAVGAPTRSSSIIKPRLTRQWITMTLLHCTPMSTETKNTHSATQRSSLNPDTPTFSSTLISRNAPSSLPMSSIIPSYLSDTTTSWRSCFVTPVWKQKWRNLCWNEAMCVYTQKNNDRLQESGACPN